MEAVKFGIVGLGVIGMRHADAFLDGMIKNGVLAAACDFRPKEQIPVGESFWNQIEFYSDYQSFIHSDLFDAVIIATPHKFHPTEAITAFQAGKHVLIEKPAGILLSEVSEMNRIAQKSNKKFGIMFNQRTNPAFQKIREMVRSGELGSIKRIVWIVNDWYRSNCYYRSGGWRTTWNGSGGGVLINQCAHNLDLWQWIFGMPDKVQAFCGYGKFHEEIEIDDSVTAYLSYSSGTEGTFITSTGEAPGTNRLEISTDQGKLVYEYGKLTLYKLEAPEPILRETDSAIYDLPVPYTLHEIRTSDKMTGHDGILQNFANAVLGKEGLLAPGGEGINSLKISSSMLLSDWKKQMISLQDGLEEYDTLLKERFKLKI